MEARSGSGRRLKAVLCLLVLTALLIVPGTFGVRAYALPVVADYLPDESGVWRFKEGFVHPIYNLKPGATDPDIPANALAPDPKGQLKKTLIDRREDGQKAKLLFVGDLMCLAGQQHGAKKSGGFDFTSSFKLVAPIFNSADFVCGNLESLISKSNPITSVQKDIYGVPQCNGPAEYLKALRTAGFDCLVTANNHCCDWGAKGITETLEELDKNHFAHIGTFYGSKDGEGKARKTKEESYVMFDVRGIKVAVLAYSHLINQRGKLTATQMSEMVACYDASRVKKDIAAARKNGAEFVVVYCHWGRENTEELTDYQKSDAEYVAECGADLVIGSHSHCLQRKTIITTKDKRKVPCMFSMSNFVSSMGRDINNDTIILDLSVSKDNKGRVSIDKIDYIPCHVMTSASLGSCCVVPTSKSLNGGIDSQVLKAAEARIRK
ncbi:MAG: CapA family protein, partial [Lachnospiraceae bacterium]|nr:CapA family protein [Lachnospiraceae bacterium]